MRHIYNFFMVLVMVLMFTACGEHSASMWTEEPEPEPDPEPQPEVVVSNVKYVDCPIKNIKWVAENAQVNVLKSRTNGEVEAYVAAETTREMLVSVEYSDGSVQTESEVFTETNNFDFFGLSEHREVSDMSIFDAQPKVTNIDQNIVNGQGFLINFSGVKIYALIHSSRTAERISFHGTEFKTCSNTMELEYLDATYSLSGKSYEDKGKIYTPYRVTLYFNAKINEGGTDNEGTIILDVKNILLVENAPVVEPEAKFMYYVWKDESLTWDGDKFITSGTLVEIWSDGSERNPQYKSCRLNWSAASPADQVKYVENLEDWNKPKTVSQSNSSQMEDKRDSYTITTETKKLSTTYKYFTCEFVGNFERASFVTPNGKETIEMLAPDFSFSSITEEEVGGPCSEGDYNTQKLRIVTSFNAGGKHIAAKSKALEANVKLMQYVAPPADPVQIGMYVENERVKGDSIVFDVVKVFDTKPEERSTEKIPHGCWMKVENSLSTQARQYGVLGTSPVKKSESFFTALGGKVNGVTEAWENVFYYHDFKNTISYYFPANLTYSENGFTDAINISAAVVSKNGSETATTPSQETETSKTYHDKIYYRMMFGGIEVGNGVQTVVYTETVEPAPEPESTYEGYHVVASRSARALVFDEPWTTYICDHIEFENNNNANDRFVLLKIWKAERNGNSWVFAKDQKGNAIKVFEEKIKGYWCGKGYPAATYVKNTSKWTLGYLTSDNGYKETWKQVAEVGTNGEGVTINPLVISKKTQGTSPEISRGKWDSTTKTYTLGGVEYR